MKSFKADVVVIGGGLAGMYTALMLPQHLNVWIVSKSDLKATNSYLAQGGIAAAMMKSYDSPRMHYEDTLKSGHYQNDLESVKVLVEEAEANMHQLETFGVCFDKDAKGQYLMGLEGAHQVARILRIGDHTGRSVMEVLAERVLASEHIHWMQNFYGIDLISDDQRCHGVRGFLGDERVEILSNWTVLATGGIGHLYSFTSNAAGIDGSGIAMALRAGVKTAHMNLTQFHPTVFYTPNLEGRQFLISEAVRGEGAILLNPSGERFMTKYDERLELAPRDIVSSAIEKEMMLHKTPFVFLDVTHLSKTFLMTRFPTIYEFCLAQGIQMERDLIPVAPRLHYFMGGIQTDLFGKSSLEGLFAVGECACTGVHGRNRLASNSLLEAVVFGRRVARAIETTADREKHTVVSMREPCKVSKSSIKRENLQEWMDTYMGINRDDKALKLIYHRINDIIEKQEMACSLIVKDMSIDDIGVYNALIVMRVMIEDALKEFETHD